MFPNIPNIKYFGISSQGFVFIFVMLLKGNHPEDSLAKFGCKQAVKVTKNEAFFTFLATY
jgi:hypothetical protein